MKKYNFSTLTVILSSLALTLGFVPSLVASDTMSLTGINSNYMETENITYTPVGGSQSTSATDYVGAITGTLAGGPSQYFFCYDLADVINVPGTYQVNPTSTSGSFPTYLGLQFQHSTALNSATSLLNSVNLASFTSVDQFAGLQLAIWSILYNWSSGAPSTTLNGSNFSVSGATSNVTTLANAFLSTAYNIEQSGHYNNGSWQVLVNANDSQGNVVQTLVGTPEPETYLLLGSFLMMSAYGLKRKAPVKIA